MRWRIDTRRLDDLRLAVGLLLPACAGVALFGWRVLGVWAFIIAGAFASRAVLARFRTWREPLSRTRIVVDAVLIGLFYPATLFDLGIPTTHNQAQWPALLAIGIGLAVCEWLARVQKRIRFHPVALAVAVVALASPNLSHTDRVLARFHVGGDILDERTQLRPTSSAEPWFDSDTDRRARVCVVAPAEVRMDDYLHGIDPAGRVTQTMSRLVSDDLPPLEDLVIGGHPTRIGCASAIALLIGGLFLVYRGYIAWRMPMIMLLATYATILVMPVPVIVGPDLLVRHWLVLSDPQVRAPMAFTFANYLMMGSPILLVTLFLATRPDLRPDRPMMIARYALVYGILAGVLTTLLSVSLGAIAAVLITQAVFGFCARRAWITSSDEPPAMSPAALSAG